MPGAFGEPGWSRVHEFRDTCASKSILITHGGWAVSGPHKHAMLGAMKKDRAELLLGKQALCLRELSS